MKKYFIVLLIIALLITSCGVVNTPTNIPDETPTETPTEAPTETPTEAPTETPTEAPAETPTEAPAETPTEAPTETPTVVNPLPSGGFAPCIHAVMSGSLNVDFAYHTIPGVFISYVGWDRFNEWYESYEDNKELFREEYNAGKRDCPYDMTIVDFVEYFDIPREVFEIILLSVANGYDYNVDVIYAGKEAAEEYYSSDRTQLCLAKETIDSIKADLRNYTRGDRIGWADSKVENGWYGTMLLEKATKKFEAEKRDMSKLPTADQAKFTTNSRSTYSLTEIIHAFDIPREKISELYTKYSKNYGYKGRFDLDALYAAEFDEEYFKTTSPLEIDMQFFTYEGK